ncbi:N-acetylneuraminate synthase [Methanolobus bombayensis]|uniref:N-acetylneuraminate synthase n=1 Tax=Methanolobus bombayensis TaxID=38023 RepID=UPI001AE6A206|nr:N-acetylneuraminate synthase [Methanolobus bombayensis]MBP1908190.1 N-acetylneuraminate synthase/N,N'-diacetyllegionaminate synthase [Methanolobus bombayensis]
MTKIRIEKSYIGIGSPCFIIAEAGVNHNGDIELAKKLVDAASDAGADAVKFQTFIAEELVTKNAPKAEYQLDNTDSSESQFEMIKKLELSKEGHNELIEYCNKKNIIFLSTPFDNKSADLLEELEVPLIKIGSGEVTNHPFLEYLSKKGLPIILSTGMSTLEEVREAVSVIKKNCNNLILLHCVSNYPARIEDSNLMAMKTMEKEFDIPVGYSDHTPGIYVPLAAVAMGAPVIEKHFTLDKSLPGPDHLASLEPFELKEMVKAIRIVEKAHGSGDKMPVDSELEVRDVARKSIVAKNPIQKNTVIKEDMLLFKRPGIGIPPKDLMQVVGKVAKENIHADEMILFEKLE